MSKQLLQYQFHCFMNRIGETQKHDLGGWWLEAGVSSPCGIPGPDSAAAGAPRPAGAHTATQICRAGAEWSLQLQSVCSHCSHQSHAADAGFLQRGFYDPAALQQAAGRRCLVCMQQLTAATPSCHSCSTVGTKTILTITTLLFIGRYVFHFAQATAVQFQ